MAYTHAHTLTDWFIDWGGAFLNGLQLSAVEVNTNLNCFSLGVCKLKASLIWEQLWYKHVSYICVALVTVLLVTRCLYWSSCELRVEQSQRRLVRVCGLWRESDEWCLIPDDYLLRVTQLRVSGPLRCSSEGDCWNIHTVTERGKWDMLTVHVIVKYQLMGIVVLEHCLTDLLMNAL